MKIELKEITFRGLTDVYQNNNIEFNDEKKIS